jgi:hypothetical protein
MSKQYTVILSERQLRDLKSYVLSQEMNTENEKESKLYGDLFLRLCAAAHVSTEYEQVA